MRCRRHKQSWRLGIRILDRVAWHKRDDPFSQRTRAVAGGRLRAMEKGYSPCSGIHMYDTSSNPKTHVICIVALVRNYTKTSFLHGVIKSRSRERNCRRGLVGANRTGGFIERMERMVVARLLEGHPLLEEACSPPEGLHLQGRRHAVVALRWYWARLAVAHRPAPSSDD